MSMIPLLSGSAANQTVFFDELSYADAAAAASGGWTNAGTVNWGNTSGPGSLSGIAALLCQNSLSNTATSATFTGSSQKVYIYVRQFAVNANTSDSKFLYIRNGSTNMVSIMARSSATNQIRITDESGGLNTTSTLTYSTGTVYQMKIEYTPGSGANGLVRVFLSTDGTSWTSYANRTSSNATGNLTNVRFAGNTSSGIYARGLLISYNDILPNALP